MTALREYERRRMLKAATPSVLLLDSQTVKAASGAGVRGYDGGKKLVGRKRHIAVDTLGLLLAVVVTTAALDDAAAAPAVLAKVDPKEFPRMTTIYADGKYHNYELYDTLIEDGPSYELRTVHRPEGAKGFVPLPKRWVVERTFAWLIGFRRLVKDYEQKTESSEARVQLAMCQVLLRRRHRLRWPHDEPRFAYPIAA